MAAAGSAQAEGMGVEIIGAGETLLEVKGLRQDVEREARISFPVWRGFRRMRLALYAGYWMIALAVLGLAGAFTHNATLAFFIFAPVMMVGPLVAIHNRAVAWLWRRKGRPAALEAYDMSLTEDGFILDYPTSVSFIPWSAVVQSGEDQRRFAVTYSPSTFATVPKRFLTPEQVEVMRDVLRRKTDFVALN